MLSQFPGPHPTQCPVYYAAEKERTVKRQVAQYRRDLLHCVGWLAWDVVESLGVTWDQMVAAQEAYQARLVAASAAAAAPAVVYFAAGKVPSDSGISSHSCDCF
jgi:hypothetical protein